MHEVALRHDARDLAAISLDNDAVNAMLRAIDATD